MLDFRFNGGDTIISHDMIEDEIPFDPKLAFEGNKGELILSTFFECCHATRAGTLGPWTRELERWGKPETKTTTMSNTRPVCLGWMIILVEQSVVDKPLVDRCHDVFDT